MSSLERGQDLDWGWEQGCEDVQPGPRTRAGRRQDGLQMLGAKPHPCYCPGDLFSCPVQSWSTGEEVARDILRHRLAPGVPRPAHPCTPRKEEVGAGDQVPQSRRVCSSHVSGSIQGLPGRYLLALSLIPIPPCAITRGLVDGWRGWTVAMKNGVQWAELAGHDYVLDLVSDLELLREFPRRKAYFLVGAEGPLACRGGLR